MSESKYIEEARFVVARHVKHGLEKANAKQDCVISSIGTERIYRICIANFLHWAAINGISPDSRCNKNVLNAYLEERSELVKQKTLNCEHNALQLIYRQKLNHYVSSHVSIYSKRSYSLSQVLSIIKRQSERNLISTLLAFFCGLRAHEFATIRPSTELNASEHREWDPNRFSGLKKYSRYCVIGKGGLIREVAVPHWLSIKLEARRLSSPIKVIDREIFYEQYYDIGFGQALSQSFSSASFKTLGYSTGVHGLRHAYAKWRLYTLLKYFENTEVETSVEEYALSILSQELGHFRIDVTFAYLR